MIVIPDLFGAYQKGRETAIDANWKDLQNYESIENARHQNDAAALANLATMADFGKRRQMVQNEATNSDLTTQLNKATHRGKLYNAESDEIIAGVNFGTLKDNQDAVEGIASNNLETLWRNAQIGANNAGTDALNSNIIYDTTRKYYDAAAKAADEAYAAGIDIQRITAQYGPEITKMALDLRLQEGYITREQHNQEV